MKSFEIAARVTALIAAFIPGASPPEVSTPIVFILFITCRLLNYLVFILFLLPCKDNELFKKVQSEITFLYWFNSKIFSTRKRYNNLASYI